MAQKGINFKITAVNKTKQAFSQIGRGLKSITRAVFSFKSAIAGVVGIGALGLLVRNSLVATDRLGKMSNVLGIAVKDLQTLKLAAEIGGIQFETLGKGVKRLIDNFGDFQQGLGEATVTFKALGITQEMANSVSGNQMAILGMIADRLSLVTNKTDKLKFATEIFGGRASDLINVLDGGSDALKRFAIESDRFGSLTADQVKAVENFNDSVTRLKTVFMNVVNQFVANISPAFLHFSEVIREKVLSSIEESRGSIAQMTTVGAKDLIDFGIKTVRTFEYMVKSVGEFTVAIRRALEVVQHPFSAKNRKQIEDFKFSLDGVVAVMEEFKKDTDKLGGSIDNNNEAMKHAGNTADTLNKEYTRLKDQLGRLEQAGDTFGSSIAKNFENAVFMGQKLSDTLKKVAQDIIRIAYTTAITKPLGEALGRGISGAMGGLSDAIFGGATTPKKAQFGTSYARAGRPMMVGEMGAEIFTPRVSGSVTPNHALGNSVQVVQKINIMPSVSDVAKAEIFGMLPLIKQEAVNGVIEARNRGGVVAKAMGVRA